MTSRVVFLLAASVSVPLLAQSTFGEIRGTVTDAGNALVQDAKVTVTNAGTTQSRTQPTDESGNYSFLNLDAGNYEVLVEKSGFGAVRTQNIVLRARETIRVDAELKPAVV